jgi:hypothetical protein
MYEYTYPSWSNDDTPKGRYYVEIPKRFMNRKVKAIEAYQSQLRKFPHPVSTEAAISLARVRGMAINVGYAEMFYNLMNLLQWWTLIGLVVPFSIIAWFALTIWGISFITDVSQWTKARWGMPVKTKRNWEDD